MIEAIKARLWKALEDKAVSLAMVYDRDGHILWHRGRTVRGRSVDDGEGFPKSLIRQTMADRRELHSEDVVVMSSGDSLPQSARALYLKSLLILPIEQEFFLYLDSGSKEGFSVSDCEVFRTLGELLGESIAAVRSRGATTGGLAGSSTAIQRVRDLVVRYALEEEPVLLLGETGVGKNHIANLLHAASGRRGPMVVVHCPSVPESLFESEMFGHRRGAFSGATDNRSGLVHEAEGGTLLLDEVSEVPPSVQAKMLSFVETRRYRVVGDSRERPADVRILAASNRDLAEATRSGTFRSDLYYRLNVLPIEIPPLRVRPEDIADLIAHHTALLRGRSPTPAFFEALARHSWPGNVRELVQVLKRIGIQLPQGDLGDEVTELLMPELGGVDDQADSHVATVENALRDGSPFWDTAWRGFLDRDLNRDQMRALLVRWYRRHGRTLRGLAEALNIDREDYPRFVSTLHKYDIHPDAKTE